MMPETLRQYRERTAFMEDSLAPWGGLRTSDGLTAKVGPDGSFRPFCGDTVIFSLEEDTIRWLADVQETLYDTCGSCLAERIAPETFHITLHDLRNQPESMPEGVADRRAQALRMIARAREEFPSPLTLRSRCMFSMVGSSVVMGFEPAGEQDCAALMTLYGRFQQLVPLSYPLTLHVTLAYYRPGVYDDAMLDRLREVMGRVGREERMCPLETRRLHYATFGSMAYYSLAREDALLASREVGGEFGPAR